jgi:CRISPR-associated protein (TIGR02710 family)
MSGPQRVRRLIFYTVGGNADPVIFSIRQNPPDRAIFIVSSQTRATVSSIQSSLEGKEPALLLGAMKIREVADAEDFTACVRVIARLFREEVEDWQKSGPEYEVVADLTGGTKCMSAALALVAQRWPCMVSYVGGAQRDKGGVGTVESGSERLLRQVNPWTALGYQAVEDALVLLKRHDYAGARDTLTLRKRLMSESDSAAAGAKRSLATLEALCEFFALWDIFEHQKAANLLREQVFKNFNDFSALFPGRDEELRARLERLQAALGEILASPHGVPIVRDLLANALRCAQRGRFDDAVARLYRALEGAAQIRVREAYDESDTAEFPADRLPGDLSQRWAAKVEDGRVKLGLQDAYELLTQTSDALGLRFRTMKLHDWQNSPLVARNQSILAHGFGPIGRKAFDTLWSASLRVLEVSEEGLTEFAGPWLASSDASLITPALDTELHAISQTSPDPERKWSFRRFFSLWGRRG